ncbi:Protein maternal effect lethal 26 [Halotydeus destructor]|nr:Protein maternal effect lethal 26 [Halotydeus destructor]
MTQPVRILSSNFLDGTFEARCELRNALKVDGGQVVTFSTPFLKEHDWTLTLKNGTLETDSPPYADRLVPADQEITVKLSLDESSMSASKPVDVAYEMQLKRKRNVDMDDEDSTLEVDDEPIQLSRKELEPYTKNGNLVVRIRIKFHHCDLPDVYNTLMKLYESIDGHLCDFDIVMRDGSLRVFKNMLCLKWPFFEKMMTSGCVECSEQTWVIDDVSYKIMRDIVVYIYCETITLNDKAEVIELMEIAHRYQLEDLVKLCANYLFYDIDVEDALKVLVISDLFDLTRLKVKCSSLISEALVYTDMTLLQGYEEFSYSYNSLRLTQECFKLASRTLEARLRKSESRKRKL